MCIRDRHPSLRSSVIPALRRTQDWLDCVHAGSASQQRSWSSSDFAWCVIFTPLRGAASCLFSLASGRASHFSLSGQREVTKRKATPTAAVCGLLPSDCAKRLRGLLTVHPWTGIKLARILASHPSGNSSATSPLHRGPGHHASCVAKTKHGVAHGCARTCFVFATHDAW